MPREGGGVLHAFSPGAEKRLGALWLRSAAGRGWPGEEINDIACAAFVLIHGALRRRQRVAGKGNQR